MQYDKKLLWKDDEREYTDQELFKHLNTQGHIIFMKNAPSFVQNRYICF